MSEMDDLKTEIHSGLGSMSLLFGIEITQALFAVSTVGVTQILTRMLFGYRGMLCFLPCAVLWGVFFLLRRKKPQHYLSHIIYFYFTPGRLRAAPKENEEPLSGVQVRSNDKKRSRIHNKPHRRVGD